MEKGAEKLHSEFNNAAARIYSHVFDMFSSSVRTIDRYDNENVFKLQEAKYVSKLKKMLEDLVNNTLEKCDSNEMKEQLKSSLPGRINYFMQEFLHKCNAM